MAFPPNVDRVAQALLRARRTHTTLPSALFARELNRPEEAYAVQDAVAHALGWFGDTPARHWKSGAPSRNAEATHAPLPPDGVWHSPARAAHRSFHRRGIEAEIALRLRQPVDAARAASLTPQQSLGLIDAMTVAIEIVDSRWVDDDAPALLKLADMQVNGALVLGDWVPFVARDWSAQTCRAQVGRQPVVQRSGSHPCGDPTWSLLAWLRHATREGATLAAGSVVTTGSWIGLLQAQPGDCVGVAFDGIGHASVQL
jgi:2-keto-4-pentenoate hydratase